MRVKPLIRFYGIVICTGVWFFHVTVNDIYHAADACVEECSLRLWKTPYFDLDTDLVLHVRQHFVDPPPDVLLEPLRRKDYDDPTWKNKGEWNAIMRNLKWIFSSIKGGAYVEIGAGVGDILSTTSWLESEKGWRGLLVEPNPFSYARLRRRRNATSANVCVSMTSAQHQADLWVPSNLESLQEPFKSIAAMSSRLTDFMDKEDANQGTTTPIQCLTLQTLLKAAEPYLLLKNSQELHLVIIDTNGGETEILQDLTGYDIAVLVIRAPSKHEREQVEFLAKGLNLTILTSPDDITEYALFIYKHLPLKILYS